jgi:putative transposase
MSELCRHYGIARKTGYKILSRWQERGAAGLADLSRAPLHRPNQTAEGIEQQVMALRRAHMTWGPRKLRGWLKDHHPAQKWPAASTIGELLKREGLAHPRRQRRHTPPHTRPLAHADDSNLVWCADFKGWFRTQDRDRIDPFTVTDAYSRYLLRCQSATKTDTPAVKSLCEATFREYGLPCAMRTDNGPPFASCAIAGLSQLALYWMRLGIALERIQPGHPEQNGRHERMHRTLKAETASPPATNRRRQQQAFDRFRHVYNHERPHEALGQRPPASVYTASPRPYPERLPLPVYDSGLLVRKVYPHGQFFWKGHDVFLSKVLAGEQIGFDQVDDRYWCIYYAAFPIAYFDAATLDVGNLPSLQPQDDGNLEIPKCRNSQIPTAPTPTA